MLRKPHPILLLESDVVPLPEHNTSLRICDIIGIENYSGIKIVIPTLAESAIGLIV